MSEQNTELSYNGNDIEVMATGYYVVVKKYDHVLSDAEMTQVYNDLAVRWGLPLLDCEEEDL